MDKIRMKQKREKGQKNKDNCEIGGEGGRERQGERCVCVYKKTGIRWKERVTNKKQSKNGTETDEKNDKLTNKQQN